MPRNKYPEITVKRILNTSLKLFLEKGYEQTTIQDIVDALGDLSKGAIYHHFKSKEDILDAISDLLYYENNPLTVAKEMSGLNGLEKIRQALLNSLRNPDQLKLYLSAPSLTKNPRFCADQVNSTITHVAPQLQILIEEGISDGSIVTNYPKQLSETMLLLSNVWINPLMFPVTEEEYHNKLQFFKTLLDQLGLPVIDQELETELYQLRSFVTSTNQDI